MNSSYHNSVTDEMLSAYIDGVTTVQETALIEAALAESSDVVWRLNSMQHTVALLNQLPELEPPRSFALTEAMAGISLANQTIHTQPAAESVGLWQAIQDFFQTGNPLIRNFAAASFAAFLILVGLGASTGEPVVPSESVTVLPAGSAMVADGPQTEMAESSTQVALRTTVAEASPPANPAGAEGGAAPMMAEAPPAAGSAMKQDAGEEEQTAMSMAEAPAQANAASAPSAASGEAASGAALELEAAAAPMAAPLEAPMAADAASVPAAREEAPPAAGEADEQAMPAESEAVAESVAIEEAAAIETGIQETGPPANESERSALWYWALISLGLAGLFAVLWLISRNNYAPAI